MADAATSFTVEDLALVLAIGAAVLVVAVGAVRLSLRTGLPSLLLYLLIGLAIGEAGMGIQYSNPSLSRVLGYVALTLILAEGGLTTSWDDIRGSLAPAALLSTVGVLVSVLVVSAAAHYVIGLEWIVALLIGAMLASTDAAAVFSVLRTVPLPSRLTSVLEAESGFNDAPAVLLVVALSRAASSEGAGTSWWALAGMTLLELAGGALIGVGVGYVGAWFMRRMVNAFAGLFPIGVMAWVLLAYGAAAVAHTSGFIAAYLGALVLGNARLAHRAAYRGFAQAMGWLAQIGLFVMLGLLASPSHLVGHLGQAVLLGLVLLLAARPLSVFVCTVWFKVSWRDQAFLSWAGLRGAVPIVLATVPAITAGDRLSWLFDLVFLLVVVFTVVQAPLLPQMARWLRVIEGDRAVNLEVEATPLDTVGADLLEVRIGATSRLHGIEVFELRLPEGADVSLIVRDGATVVPDRSTVLRRGDQLLIVCTAAARARTERQLHAVDDAGRLAGWPAAAGHRQRGAGAAATGGRPASDGLRRPGPASPGASSAARRLSEDSPRAHRR